MTTLSTEQIRGEKWEFYGALSMPLYITIYPPIYTSGFQARYGNHIDVLNTYEGRRVHWYMKADQLEILATQMLPQFLEEQWKYYDRWQNELKVFEDTNQKFLNTSLETLTDAETRSLMREYRESFAVPFVTNNIIEPLSYYFQNNLKRLLTAEGIAEERASELMDAYGQAARPSYIKLAAEAYRSARTPEERDAALRTYYYIFNDYQGVKQITEDDLTQLAGSTPYVWAPEIRTEGISARAQALLNVMQVIATIQDVRKGAFLQMVYAAKRFGEEHGRRNNIAFEDMEFATWAEVEEGEVRVESLRARKEPFALYWRLEGVSTIEGAEGAHVTRDMNAFVFATEENAQEVNGTCASKGLARGRAVIVFDPKEFGKVQAGDILITMMTRPEFLPVMHRAAAFVCDEGGLTSHAAIVAREMKKPCVVGTKVGTRVFKDGDMVEVDANSGIVRKIV